MKKSVVAALLLAAVAPALAATAPEKGFYLGADVGNGKMRHKNCVAACSSPTKNTEVVGGILLGYKYNKNLAVEAKFTGTGKWENSNIPGNIKGDAVALTAMGIVPVTNEISGYGKLGVASLKAKVSNSTGMGVKDTRNSSFTIGVGAQYNVTSAIGVRLGYDYYRGKAESTVGGNDWRLNCDVWSVGAVYRF